MNLVRRGRCWKVGDDISNDQLLSSRFVFDYNLDILTKNCLVDVIPEFPARVREGDVVLAGHRFGHGSLHIHPFLGLEKLGVGVLCGSMPRGAFRLAVYAGVPLLTGCQEIYVASQDGDELEVDFGTGHIHNCTRDVRVRVEPLSPFLLDIVQAGGGIGFIQRSAAR